MVEDTLHLLQLQVKKEVENALHQNRPTLNALALTHLRCCLRTQLLRPTWTQTKVQGPQHHRQAQGKGPPVLQVQAPKVMGP